MTRGSATTSGRAKAVSKGTHSCPCCSVWVCTTRWRQARAGWLQVNTCLRFWMTRTSCLFHNERDLCTTSWTPRWRQAQGSSCTRGRPAFGTGAGSDPRTSTIWVKKCGVRRECKCWGLQLDQKRSSKLSQTGDSRRNTDCGMRSRLCLICSALGSCCCNAQAHDAITC